MSDRGHIDALAGTESVHGAAAVRVGTRRFRWGHIALAFVLLGVLAFGVYRFTWPVSYRGPVRWNSDYTTLTLVDSGIVLAVSEETDLSSGSGNFANLALLRSGLLEPSTASFEAKVIWRPYLRRGTPSGFAQSVQRR